MNENNEEIIRANIAAEVREMMVYSFALGELISALRTYKEERGDVIDVDFVLSLIEYFIDINKMKIVN